MTTDKRATTDEPADGQKQAPSNLLRFIPRFGSGAKHATGLLPKSRTVENGDDPGPSAA